MARTTKAASPEPFMAYPRAKPPATIQMTDQLISSRSYLVTMPAKAKTAKGMSATV